MQNVDMVKVNTAAKRHKTHKKNNLDIVISNSYKRQKHKFRFFTNLSRFDKDPKKHPGEIDSIFHWAGKTHILM